MSDILSNVDGRMEPSVCPLAIECEFGVECIDGMGGIDSTQRVKESGRWGWFVSCACAAVGPSADSRDEAIRAWNRRVEPRQMRLEVGE